MGSGCVWLIKQWKDFLNLIPYCHPSIRPLSDGNLETLASLLRILYSCGLEWPKHSQVLPCNCWLFKDSPKKSLTSSKSLDSSLLGKMSVFPESQIYHVGSFSNSLIWLSFQRLKSWLWVWIEAKLEENNYTIYNRTLINSLEYLLSLIQNMKH